jgi:hypothetical protein
LLVEAEEVVVVSQEEAVSEEDSLVAEVPEDGFN